MARYVVEPLLDPTDLNALGRWLERELQKVEEALSQYLENPMEVSHAEPMRKDQTRILFAFADGTDWNPGSGRGLYYYDPDLLVWKKVQVV